MGVVLIKMLINSIFARHYFEPFEFFLLLIAASETTLTSDFVYFLF